ncbi:MAG: hypothetical protein ABIH23_35395 [bacterium]
MWRASIWEIGYFGDALAFEFLEANEQNHGIDGDEKGGDGSDDWIALDC